MARVLFIQKQSFFQQERIGIMQLSAVLKAHGHATDLLITKALTPEQAEDIRARHYDIIAFSVMSIEADWYIDIGSQLKGAGVTALVIAGGPHPSFNPDYLQHDCLDAINIGEGELSLLELAEAISAGRDISAIRNLHVKRDGQIYKNPVRPLTDLDELPLPDRDLYLTHPPFRTQGTYHFVFSRGCPYACSYCFAHQWNALYDNNVPICFKSVDACIREILDFSRKTDVKLVYFQDSTFNLKKQWTLDFFKKYTQSVKIPFSLNLRPNLVDEDMVKAAAETGYCKSVRIGIETGSERLRLEVLNKHVTDKQIYDAAALLKKYKIKLVTYVMLGLPGETFAEAWQTIIMLQKIKPFSFSAQMFHPYPMLKLTDYAVQNGYLKHKDIAKINSRNIRYYAFSSVLSQPEIEQVTNSLKLSVLAIRFPFLTGFLRYIARREESILINIIYIIMSAFVLAKQVDRNPLSMIIQFLKNK